MYLGEDKVSHIPYNPQRFIPQMQQRLADVTPQVAIRNYIELLHRVRNFLWGIVSRSASVYDSQVAQSVANNIDMLDAYWTVLSEKYDWNQIASEYPALIKVIKKTLNGPTPNPADKEHWKVSILGAMHELGILDSSVSNRFGAKIQREKEAIQKADLDSPDVSFIIKEKIIKSAYNKDDKTVSEPLKEVIRYKYKETGEAKKVPTPEPAKNKKAQNTGLIAAGAALAAFILMNR